MTAAWTDTDEQGNLTPGRDWPRTIHPAEIIAAINRRRRLLYLSEQDFSGALSAGRYVRADLLAGVLPGPLLNLRAQFPALLAGQPGVLGGQPPTPTKTEWLWPLADDDENAVIVMTDPGAGEVALLDRISPTGGWTDAGLAPGRTPIRAAHINELRRAAELLRRGRWTLPVYFASGLFSMLPDTPWIGDSVANNGADELRSVACILARLEEAPPRGLTDVTVRPASRIEITADTNCQVRLYRCLRPLSIDDPPTWNRYSPTGGLSWSSPGGLGPADAGLIGQLSLQANVPAALSGSAVASALQAMLDGRPQWFILTRADIGYETIAVNGSAVIEFNLNSPPN